MTAAQPAGQDADHGVNKPFDQIERADIERLVTHGVREGRYIDYKMELPKGDDGERKEFARDVTATLIPNLEQKLKAIKRAPDRGHPDKHRYNTGKLIRPSRQRLESIFRVRTTLQP